MSPIVVGSPNAYAGTPGAGTTANVTINAGEFVTYIAAFTTQNSATITVFSIGQPIVIPNGASIWWWTIPHQLIRATALANVIAFTNVNSYFVASVKLGGTSTPGNGGL